MSDEDPNAAGNPDDTPWYGADVKPDHVDTLKRYKGLDTFIDAFFEQRRTISEGIRPPSPDLKPEEHAAALRAARLRLGALDAADKYRVTPPDDLADFIAGKLPKYLDNLKAEAAEYGLTQYELDQLAEKRFADIRTFIQEGKTADEAAQKAAAELKQANDKALEDLWHKEKETNLGNARLLAKHFDDTLFFTDNESLSEEEMAEKGGRLVQMLRQADSPLLWRLFAHLHGRLLAEPKAGGSPNGGKPTVYSERYERAKALYPNRPQQWEELAKSQVAL